jgi:DNA-binding PadR family transcriptional regulator
MTTYHDLTGFQRDLLEAIAAVDGDPYGLALKEYLDERYADPINHSRLYQNLDQLVEQDLINRDELDARTNVYTLTDAGRQLLQCHAETLAGLCDLARPVPDGGASA